MADEEKAVATVATDPASAMRAAVAQIETAVASKRSDREAINLEIERLRIEARALTDDINAMEDSIPDKKFTGKVVALKI